VARELSEGEAVCRLAGLAVYLTGLQVTLYLFDFMCISGDDEMLK
jgi:hypothetical protein